MIYEILLYVLLIVIYTGRGVEQGILFSKKATDAFKWNEHIPIVIVRVAIMAAIFVGGMAVATTKTWYLFFIGVSFIPAFWFWKDTAYYYTRHKIDSSLYINWFKAESTTSSSELIKAMPYKYRLLGLGISLVAFVVFLFLQ